MTLFFHCDRWNDAQQWAEHLYSRQRLYCNQPIRLQPSLCGAEIWKCPVFQEGSFFQEIFQFWFAKRKVSNLRLLRSWPLGALKFKVGWGWNLGEMRVRLGWYEGEVVLLCAPMPLIAPLWPIYSFLFFPDWRLYSIIFPLLNPTQTIFPQVEHSTHVTFAIPSEKFKRPRLNLYVDQDVAYDRFTQNLFDDVIFYYVILDEPIPCYYLCERPLGYPMSFLYFVKSKMIE